MGRLVSTIKEPKFEMIAAYKIQNMLGWSTLVYVIQEKAMYARLSDNRWHLKLGP